MSDAVAGVRSIVDLRLNSFNGLAPMTTRADVVQAAGSVIAEAAAGGTEVPLWMTVHELMSTVRLTAWYELDERGTATGVTDDHLVRWIERPILPEDVRSLIDTDAGHRPPGRDHILAWPERGLCVRSSRRSGLPTLLFAFPSIATAEFDASPMAHRD